MKTIWLILVGIAIGVAASAAVSYLRENRSSETNGQPSEATQSTQTNTTSTVVDLASLKVGMKVGDFTVSAIEPFTKGTDISDYNVIVRFTGETTVTGRYLQSDLLGTPMIEALDVQSIAVLPRLAHDERSPWFAFLKSDTVAAQELGGSGNTGQATIRIADFAIELAETEVANSARLVAVTAKYPGAAPAIQYPQPNMEVTDDTMKVEGVTQAGYEVWAYLDLPANETITYNTMASGAARAGDNGYFTITNSARKLTPGTHTLRIATAPYGSQATETRNSSDVVTFIVK